MKRIKTHEAVGEVLAHDITRIIPGRLKGAAFRKGHIIRDEDVPELLKLGKRYLYVLDKNESGVHEDDAAIRIAQAISGENLTWTPPVEGKSTIVSLCDGILTVNVQGLFEINRLGDLIVSTLKSKFPCKKEQMVAATRIIPLSLSAEEVEEVEEIAERFYPVVRITPYRKMRYGAVVTGSEILDNLIQDGFDHHVGEKLTRYGCELVKKLIVADDPHAICDAIRELKMLGCDLIVTTGGLSVDPDDVTPLGIKETGATIVCYGSPVLPGAMFLYARLDETPILGLPACVYYHSTTICDLVLPRVIAGDPITQTMIHEMGHGGLCLNCDVCRYPMCPFGK